MKRLMIVFFIMFLAIQTVAAVEGSLLAFSDNAFDNADFENITVLNQQSIPKANVTTTQNQTFAYDNACKVTYINDEGKIDYYIKWECEWTDDYIFLSKYDLRRSCSGYLTDGSVFYAEESDDTVRGIILDTQNITYSEENLVYGILGLKSIALSDDHDASLTNAVNGNSYYSGQSHYNGPVIDPYETVRNDPYAYYDYFDYEDDIAIDEYLYDSGYDE